MKKIFFIIIFAASLYSQESGSPYSRFGLGFFNYSISTRSTGNAGTSIAIFDENELNNLNPATWSKIKNTVFSSGLFYESSTSEDNNGKKKFQNMNFSNTVLGVPLEKDKEFVLALGLFSKSKVGYNIYQNVIVNDLPAKSVYFGTGGISEFMLGLTFSPMQKLNVGFKTGYNFGEVQHSGKLQFNNSEYIDNEYLNSIYVKGFSFTGGIIYSGLGDLLGIHYGNAGFLFSPKSNLRAKKERYSNFSSSSATISDTVVGGEKELILPLNYGLGFDLGLNEKYHFAFDYLFTGWEDYKYNGLSENLKNSQRLSFCLETIPKKDLLAPLSERARYSLGFYYERMNLEINGTRINEYGITLGIGVPLSRNAFINSAIIYGRRGKNENGLILDNFIKVHLSINLNELWFVNTEDQ